MYPGVMPARQRSPTEQQPAAGDTGAAEAPTMTIWQTADGATPAQRHAIAIARETRAAKHRGEPAPGAFEVAVEPLTDIARLGEAWRDLEAHAAASFFLSWHWIGCWLESIDVQPMVLVARLSGRIVGLGLLHLRRQRRHGVFTVPTLYLNKTGDEAQDVITIEYNDILADRAVAPAVRRACLAHLLESGRIDGQRWDELAWGGAHESLGEELSQLGYPWRLIAEAPSAAVDLEAVRASGRPFLAHLSANTRHQIRRAIALYEERGPLRLETARTVDQGLRLFAEAGALHQARWTARGQPGAFAFPFYIAFHERLIRRCLPAGTVELVRVSAGEQPIGYLYNLLYRGTAYYYFSGFLYEPDNRLKPGLVTHCLCIKRHLERGMRTYDFMGGDNRYKTSLGQPGPAIIAAAIQQPRLLLALEGRLRRLKHLLIDRHRRPG